ncbi:hypothetical protein HU200_051350 [Digitaria exilis]|uniref:Cathepsin propeptide inhibitor domain-containing protein n=1 Tax=Digitaria exilis TaxID=1010633 RepID=A0A835AVE7_9POAL|nr:hypothetical protein HU200_051350 [Digitaria exilis]
MEGKKARALVGGGFRLRGDMHGYGRSPSPSSRGLVVAAEMRRSTALTAAAAAAALMLLLLVGAYMSIAAYMERSEEVETRRRFRDWMAKVNKTYDSVGEEEHRYAVFRENLRRFDKHGTFIDAAGLPNGFGDLTDEELSSLNLGSVPAYSFDWREKWSGGGGGGRGESVSR